mmetsp:Transcript_7831/g.24774  ORF Transcript_7831/g.24774 Transcript_7831/m.24774 type:complete len:201 (-) Transcript_7831:26-628(-)
MQKHKVVFLGDEAAGKTSLVRRYMYDTFEENIQATIGMDFQSKTVHFEERTVRLQLWDTAGQERFRALIPGYLRDSSACIVVYDITSRPSFEGARSWVDQALQDRARKELVLALVGNKVDLEVERAVPREEGEALARELGMLFFEASARTADCVDEIFEGVALALPLDAVPGKSELDDEEIVLQAPREGQARHTSKRGCC